MPRLAANLSLLHGGLDFLDRYAAALARRLADHGPQRERFNAQACRAAS